MSAKLLEPLKDERKQIGCMPGFIHLFEPNQAALHKRITNTMSIRTLQGNSKIFRGSCGVEGTINPYVQHGSEMRQPARNLNDKFGVYTESSRASCSSSPLSSFSSVDYSKVMHPEPSSYDRIIFPESPLLDRSLSHSSSSWRMRHRSFDLDDVVKDLSCTTDGVEESMLLKPQDCLRSLQPMKLGVQSVNVLSERKGSIKAPLKVKDPLCFYNDNRKHSRLLDESTLNRFERKEVKCYKDLTNKTYKNDGTLDELASLSLDSSTESNSGLGKMYHNQRPPSAVEKLMGLEAMPGSIFNAQISDRFAKIGDRKDSNMIHGSVSPASTCMTIQVSSAQRSLRKDHAAPWKPISSSRILIEPAPWKLQDMNRVSQKTVVKSKQGTACESDGYTALYSKFEGRLRDIEFQRSSEDLKALKQMLDAVQQNGNWQTENKIWSNRMMIKHDQNLDMTPKPVQQQNHQKACMLVVNGEQESCVKTMRSPIVLMKPIKLLAKSDIAASSMIQSEGMRHHSKPQGSDSAIRKKTLSNVQTVKVQNTQNGYRSPQINPSEKKLIHTQPNMPQSLLKEKKMNTSVLAGSASPKMQQKKFDAVKMSVPKPKHPGKSCTKGEKSQSKYSLVQQCNAQSNGLSTDSKDASCGDDTEVTSKLRVDHKDGCSVPARKVVRPVFTGIKKQKPSRIFNEDTFLANPGTVAAEQPSPVSVLDSLAYRDDPPSPLLKKMANFGTTEIVTRMSSEKLKQIEDLVHKLNGVGPTPNTDFIESLCKTTNPDQRYISKILLSSGFLFRDFESSSTSFQPHISGNPINPDLFFVMEQTKSSALPVKDHNSFSASKSHRRLIFDSCNEILAELLVPSGMSNYSRPMPKKLAKRNVTSRRLLNNICDRIEQLQAKNTQQVKVLQEEGHNEDDGLKKIVHGDMMLKPEKWGNSETFVPEVVLDIERMLFKDLVKEIVSDEALLYSSQPKAERSCHRKLHFNKI